MMALDSSRSLLIRLFAVAALMLVVPTVFLSVRALDAFEQSVIPEMDRKAAAIGRDLTAQVERAVRHGIPIAQLVGMDEFFAPMLSSNPEIRYLAVTDDRGRMLFLSGTDRDALEPHYRAVDPQLADVAGSTSSIGPYSDFALPVMVQADVQGFVHVGFERDYVTDRLTGIILDIGAILVVALVVAFEILLFVVASNITGPLRRVGTVSARAGEGDYSHVPAAAADDEVGRFVRAVAVSIRRLDEKYRALAAYMDEVRAAHFDRAVVERVAAIQARIAATVRFSPTGKPKVLIERRATDIRLPLFLFVFAEELSRPFLPLYAGQVAPSLAGLAVETVMALPITLFMACAALASPMGGNLVRTMGPRRLFLWGLVPSLFGFVMTALAQGAFDLILWRAVTGIGYAVVTMACQGAMAEAVFPGRRAQGMGAFAAAVLTAGLCGVLMGGVLAEWVGFRATFLVSAVLVALAALAVPRMLDAGRTTGHDEQHRPRLRRLLCNWRFSVLMAFAAVPAKVALTGFVFLLVPVALAKAGWGVGETARLMVVYPLVMLLAAAVAARLSDRLGWNVALVAVGGVVGGVGLLAPLVLPQPWSVAAALAGLGLAHGLAGAPLLSMLPDVCRTEFRALGQTEVVGFVRFIERLGSTLGPLLAAAFLAAWGVSGAMLALGAVVLAPAAVFAVLSAAYGPQSREDGP